MLRNTLKMISLFLCLTTLGITGARANDINKMTIVFSGNIGGKLTPTLICGGELAGGFSRRSSLVNEIRMENKNVLMVDNGGLFAVPARKNQEMRARLSFALYDLMELAALNLGQREFYFGPEYLAKLSETVSFPLVSSNIKSDTPLPWLHRYVIKEVGGFKVGIVGVLPENAFDYYVDPALMEGLSIMPPEEALKELVPQIKEKTDMVLLLSQLGDPKTTELVKAVGGINLAVASSQKLICESPIDKNKMVVPSGMKGQYLLSVEVAKGEKGIVITQNDPVVLNQADKHDPLVDQIISDADDDFQDELRARKMQPGTASNVKVYHDVDKFSNIVKEKRKELRKLRGEPEGEEIKARLKYGDQVIPAEIRLIREKDPQPTEAGQKETGE